MLPRLLLFLTLSVSCSVAQVPGYSRADADAQQRKILISPVERQQVIDGIIARIREDYIVPEAAGRIIDTLRANMGKGVYGSIFDGPGLAAQLTSDLKSASNDKHFRVSYSEAVLPAEDSVPSTADREAYKGELERTNCGFQSLAVLPGNVGYVQIGYFADPEPCADTLATAMKFVSHTDTLLFDLRQNRGGDPRMVALLESYLFDHSVHVNDIYNRREKKTTQYWTTPEKLAVRMPTQPVYILTSRLTFSAAEQLCYDLRNLHRAMLIGERTGGAAHPIRNRRLSDHFLISVPEYRYISPVTSSDWEGAGITPDVPAAPWNGVLVAKRVIQNRSIQPVVPAAQPVSAQK